MPTTSALRCPHCGGTPCTMAQPGCACPRVETPLQRARRMLEETACIPRMYAVTKEALIMRAATIIEIFVPLSTFTPIDLYRRHLEHTGSAVLGCDDEFTTEWAQAVIADALTFLPAE